MSEIQWAGKCPDSAPLLRIHDEECRRVARELHDTVAQSVAALSINLSLLGRAQASLNSRQRQALNDSLVLAETASKQIRALGQRLYPPLLEEIGIEAVLRSCTEEFACETGLRIESEIGIDAANLPPQVQVTLYRILREALSNVKQHSRSASVHVSVCATPTGVTVEVVDTGRGLPAAVLAALAKGAGALRGQGIRGLVARVTELGGSVQLKSGDKGTALRVVLPLTEA